MGLKINKLVRKCTRLSITGLVILAVLEIALRVLGYSVPVKPERGGGPRLQIADEELGWRLIPGSHHIPPSHPGDDYTDMTINENGNRITKPLGTPTGDNEIYLIGGSFTLGVGLNDNENYVWKLQQQLKNYNIKNLGVGAYGSLQSLITLEKELQKPKKPKLVIYGYIDHHKIRDVAHHSWINMLYSASGGYMAKIPYATINNKGELEKEELIKITKVPLSGTLVSLQLVQRALTKAIAYPRERDATQVSKLLIQEMKELCDRVGAEFYVAVLMDVRSDNERLIPFLEENQIKYIDCNVELNETNLIKGDVHPNESVHDIYARRIANKLMEDGIKGFMKNSDEIH